MNPILEQFIGSLDKLPDYLSSHVLISAMALAIGILVSLPLAIAATRIAVLRVPLLGIASVVQTIPSLALLALFYFVIVLLMPDANNEAGDPVGPVVDPSIVAAIAALALYSMLPVMRNTVTGILGVDPALTEAARGMGMTPTQQLLRVELPLAAPVIIAGIRTATVWVVGIATLATPVGQECLGNFIFSGLYLQEWGVVLMGCVAAALLAVMLDALIAQLQAAAENRQRWRGVTAGVVLVAVLGGGMSPLLRAEPTHLVGAKNFDEQYILGSLMRDQLRDAGYNVAKRQDVGSTVLFQMLANDQIDAYVDYSGTIWAVQMQRDDVLDGETVMNEVTQWLDDEHGIKCLGPLGFENAYALAMRRDKAEELGIESIEDLAAHSADLSVGGSIEFFGRAEWESVRDGYGLAFDEEVGLEPTFMYEKCRNGEIDVIVAFSSDGRIAAYDLLVLEDPRSTLPPYDAMLLVSEQAAQDEELLDALRPLVGSISDDLMRQANYMVDRKDDDRRTVDSTAQWLSEQIDG